MAQAKNIMLGTAGHVDHGKTALVKLLTGCDTDTLAEEKARGLTLDLGFAPCRFAGDRVVGIVDVPGHVDFIRHMVAGAHGIDIVLLVVAADDGVMPQTLEHLDILTLMGVRRGLVALTKIDLVEPGRVEEVTGALRRLLTGTFLESAPICPLSNLTGEGFDAFFDALTTAVEQCEGRPCTGLFRTWIADAFSIKGFGTVVTGIPSSGKVVVGDQVFIVPGNEKGRVRRLEVYGTSSTEGRAGECVALNVPEFEHATIRRGMVLTSAETIEPVTMVEGEFRLLGNFRGEFKDGTEVHLHIGTASLMARVALLEREKMLCGESQMVQLRMAAPLGVVPGDRFVVRATVPFAQENRLVTIGGGRVLSVTNTKLRRRRPWTISALLMRADSIDDSQRWIEQVLRESDRPLSIAEWAKRAFKPQHEMMPEVEALCANSHVMRTPLSTYVHRETVDRISDEVLRAIKNLHAANAKRVGFHVSEIAEAMLTDSGASNRQVDQFAGTHDKAGRLVRPDWFLARAARSKELLELAIGALLKKGEAERRGELLAQAGSQVAVSTEEEQMLDRVESALRTARFAPPRADELADCLGLPVELVQSAIKLLVDRGKAIEVSEGMAFHCEAVFAAEEIVLAMFRRGPSFTTMQFRDALGVSRKYAVPLLDYFDARRITVRTGNVRTPGAVARQRLSQGE